MTEPKYSEAIQTLREQLKAMVKEDQEVRFAVDLTRMEAVDAKNRPEVLRIFRSLRLGYQFARG